MSDFIDLDELIRGGYEREAKLLARADKAEAERDRYRGALERIAMTRDAGASLARGVLEDPNA